MAHALCKGCFRPMRPPRTKISDYPGTVQLHARNVCAVCYKQGNVPHGDHTPASVEDTRAGLERYLAARRPFRAKAGTLS